MNNEEIIAYKARCEAIFANDCFKPKNAIRDGIINIDKYVETSPKILWILKEPNSRDSGWTFQDYLSLSDIKDKIGKPNDTLKLRTFYRMLKISYCLINKIPSIDLMPNIEEEAVYSVGEQIAYINIKKSGGANTSYYKTIAESYSQNRKLLMEQIQLYAPEIIIFGGTFDFFSKTDLSSIDWVVPDSSIKTKYSTAYNVSLNKIAVKAFHPSYWLVRTGDYCNDIIKTVNSLRK